MKKYIAVIVTLFAILGGGAFYVQSQNKTKTVTSQSKKITLTDEEMIKQRMTPQEEVMIIKNPTPQESKKMAKNDTEEGKIQVEKNLQNLALENKSIMDKYKEANKIYQNKIFEDSKIWHDQMKTPEKTAELMSGLLNSENPNDPKKITSLGFLDHTSYFPVVPTAIEREVGEFVAKLKILKNGKWELQIIYKNPVALEYSVKTETEMYRIKLYFVELEKDGKKIWFIRPNTKDLFVEEN